MKKGLVSLLGILMAVHVQAGTFKIMIHEENADPYTSYYACVNDVNEIPQYPIGGDCTPTVAGDGFFESPILTASSSAKYISWTLYANAEKFPLTLDGSCDGFFTHAAVPGEGPSYMTWIMAAAVLENPINGWVKFTINGSTNVVSCSVS